MHPYPGKSGINYPRHPSGPIKTGENKSSGGRERRGDFSDSALFPFPYPPSHVSTPWPPPPPGPAPPPAEGRPSTPQRAGPSPSPGAGPQGGGVRGRKDARRGRGWQGPRQPWRTRAVRKEMGAIAASRGLFLHLGTLCAAVSRFIGRERVSRRPSRTLF